MTKAGVPRIQGLDGLRAFSIALVLLAHVSGTRGFLAPVWLGSILHQFELGMLGVRVFFVMSGFLITSLLLAEFNKSGTISLRHFYLRRTLRIFPPFYVYIAVVATCALGGLVSLRPGDLAHAVTYTENYHRDRAWHLGHTWSLAVEEQFYLLWPAVFRWLGLRRSVRVLSRYLLLAPAWRLTVSVLFPQARLGIGETFFTTADSIATGCLLAILRPQLLESGRYRHAIDSRWFYLVPPALLAFNALGRFAKLDWLFCMAIQNLLIAGMIERLTRDTGWMARVLAWRPIRASGAVELLRLFVATAFSQPERPRLVVDGLPAQPSRRARGGCDLLLSGREAGPSIPRAAGRQLESPQSQCPLGCVSNECLLLGTPHLISGVLTQVGELF